MELSSALNDFCNYSNYVRGYSKKTIDRYRATVTHLQRHIQAQEVGDCSEFKVREFFYYGRQEKHWAPTTFITYLNSLAVFFRWCVGQGYLTSNPTTDIEMPRKAKKLPSRLTKQEALHLLDVVSNYPFPHAFQRYRNYAILATFILAGLRKSELLQLKMPDVDLANMAIFVHQGKGNKDRIIPIGPTLGRILNRYREQRIRLNKACSAFFVSMHRDMGFTEAGLKRLVDFLKDKSGIQFSIHKLRHTFATIMLEGGCDIFSLSKILGHSDIKTTTIYLAASPEHLRAQMLKHPFDAF
ncbi:conserved hypothetical protein [Candidatus Zixiibacteriota bacterium]|nr:conserved hypothetical protein [candidate division Zixibacteria bacterium]